MKKSIRKVISMLAISCCFFSINGNTAQPQVENNNIKTTGPISREISSASEICYAPPPLPGYNKTCLPILNIDTSEKIIAYITVDGFETSNEISPGKTSTIWGDSEPGMAIAIINDTSGNEIFFGRISNKIGLNCNKDICTPGKK